MRIALHVARVIELPAAAEVCVAMKIAAAIVREVAAAIVPEPNEREHKLAHENRPADHGRYEIQPIQSIEKHTLAPARFTTNRVSPAQ